MILRSIAVLLAVVDATYMTYDGARALLTGEYLTPKSGAYAGQLGPWTKLARALGIEPRSTLMKSVFLVYGLIWLAVIAGYVAGARWGWAAMLALAAGSLWNLWMGTAVGATIVVLLLLSRLL